MDTHTADTPTSTADTHTAGTHTADTVTEPVPYQTGPARATRRDIGGPHGHLAHLRPFGRIGGRNAHTAHTGAPVSYGRLPEPFRATLTDAANRGAIAYVVYSYATPIAWVYTSGFTYVPDVSYSRTTSRHQTVTWAWLAHATSRPNGR